jgi:SAM-dependent methyltransferase
MAFEHSRERRLDDCAKSPRAAERDIVRRLILRAIGRVTPPSIRDGLATRYLGAGERPQWLRTVITKDALGLFESLGPPELEMAEISGDNWSSMPWLSRTQLDFPEFDLCSPPDVLPGPFDLVICEQVLEHVVDPLKAVRTLRQLCKPSGHVYVATPFLVRLHDYPGDYWRFTPDGLSLLLRSQGLEPLWVRSWGNRHVIVANFDRWVSRFPWGSLRNEPDLPAVVWALARPDSQAGERTC